MSIARCEDCEKNYDTDFEAMYDGICDSCGMEAEEVEEEGDD